MSCTPTHTYQETGERFCEPLDYIFLSPEWKVNDAIQLQSKEEALNLPCPFPDQVSKGGVGSSEKGEEGWNELKETRARKIETYHSHSIIFINFTFYRTSRRIMSCYGRT